MAQHQVLLGWPSWIGVVVDDLEAQRRFWGEMLGVPEHHAGPDFVHFLLPTGEMFEVLGRSDRREYDGRRFQVGFDVDDVEATRAELIRRGVTPISEVMGGDSPTPWAYFLDPEGNVFEIKQRSVPAP